MINSGNMAAWKNARGNFVPYVQKKFSEHDLTIFYKFRSKKPVLVDVGGHYGEVSQKFAQKGWRVIVFEAEKENFAKLKKKLVRYGDKVVCINRAVSDATGDCIPFYISDQHHGIHSLKPFHNTHQFECQVETIRLADALKEFRVNEI